MFFGHVIENARRTRKQSLVPVWRGAPLDSRLCIQCFSALKRELDAKDFPLVIAPSLPSLPMQRNK